MRYGVGCDKERGISEPLSELLVWSNSGETPSAFKELLGGVDSGWTECSVEVEFLTSHKLGTDV